MIKYHCLTLVCASLLTLPLVASEPAIVQRAHTDKFGDPLPDGAIARLGTTRFMHQDWVRSVAFVQGDRRIVAACARTACLWETASGREAFRSPELNSIMCAAVTCDGKTLAVAENGDRIFFIDVATGKTLGHVEGRDRAGAVAWSPDGKRLAAGMSKTLFIWDVAGKKLLHASDSDSSYLTSVAFSPNGALIATGDRKCMQLWDADTGKPVRTLEHKLDSQGLIFAPDGKTLVGPCSTVLGKGSFGSSLAEWDVATGKRLREIGHGTFNCTAFSADGSLLASGEGHYIRLRDMPSGQLRHKWVAHEGHVTAVAFSSDGKTLVSGGYDYRVRLWDTATGKERQPAHGHVGVVHAVAFAPDGKELVAGGVDCTLRFWDPFTGVELRRCNDAASRALGDYWGVRHLTYAPNGKTLVSAEAFGDCRLWDARSGKQLSRFGDRVSAVAFARDHETVIVAEDNKGLAAWEPTRATRLRQVGKKDARIVEISLSSDRRRVAWIAGNHEWGVRDLDSGKDLFRTRPKNSYGAAIAFSPDGTIIATGDQQGPVQFWDAATGKTLGGYDTKRVSAGRLAFSPDGRLLAAASGRELFLWEVASPQVVRRFRADNASITALAFAPNGRVVVTSGQDGTLLTWDVTGLLQDGRLPLLKLSDEQLAAHYADLVGADPVRAQRAIWALAAAAPRSLKLVAQNLPPVEHTPEKITRLVADLDNEAFAVREKATKELTALGETASMPLHRALAAGPPLEVRRRIEQLLRRLDNKELARKWLHEQRALAVLEYAGGDEAKQLLERLAAGDRDAKLTKAARAALQRLGKP